MAGIEWINRSKADKVWAVATLVLLLLVSTYPVAQTPIPSSEESVGTPSDMVIVGDAYDLKGGQLRYRELHYEDLTDPLGRVVKTIHYQSDKGDIFAEKTLVFSSQDDLRPQLEQYNKSTGRRVSVKRGGDSDLDLPPHLWLLDYQANRETQPTQKTLRERLDSHYMAVIDAGFDGWVAQHWSQLRAGQPQTFLFLAPTKARWIQLQASQAPCSNRSFVGLSPLSHMTCIVVEPSNPLLRWLVDPIELGYQEQADGTPKLLQFVGLANLTDREGKGIRVAIRYRYHALSTLAER